MGFSPDFEGEGLTRWVGQILVLHAGRVVASGATFSGGETRVRITLINLDGRVLRCKTYMYCRYTVYICVFIKQEAFCPEP